LNSCSTVQDLLANFFANSKEKKLPLSICFNIIEHNAFKALIPLEVQELQYYILINLFQIFNLLVAVIINYFIFHQLLFFVSS